jgi:hypothetical protein
LKKIFIFIIITILLISVIIVFRNPIIAKFLSGTARIIGKEIRSEIYINGKRELNAKLFIAKSNFEETEKRDYLILYLRNLKDYNGTPVLIIDRENQIVKIPNANEKDYNLVFENLLQSDSGANVMIPINDKIKGLGFEPNLKFEDKKITFNTLENNNINQILIKMLP